MQKDLFIQLITSRDTTPQGSTWQGGIFFTSISSLPVIAQVDPFFLIPISTPVICMLCALKELTPCK